MKQPIGMAGSGAVVLLALLGGTAVAQVSQDTLQSISTPESVDTRIGTLDFPKGTPSAEAASAVYDNLDFTFAFRAFTDTFQGVSVEAFRRGFESFGIKDNEFLITSELLDSSSVWLTANADTVYFWSFVDLSDGPMVFESPPGALGTIDDMWFRWIIDFGRPGPDRGEGGKYLLVGPGYDGYLPEGKFDIAHSRTNRVQIIGRSFLKDNEPASVVEEIKATTKLYPYVPGGVGMPIARFLEGGVEMTRNAKPKTPVFHEGTGLEMITVPPNDYSYYELLNDLVQAEPATALGPELMGPIAAIGIKKGQDFAPDDRMKKILTDAVALANATGRTLSLDPRDPDWYYYENSQWYNPLFISGYKFETPIAEITPEGAKPFPPTGYRQNDARTWFFYTATVNTPAMAMRLTDIGSQYLQASKDADGNYFDGAKTYKVTLPKDISQGNFWSLTVYDNQTRSMLQTPQKYPRAGSQSYPSPAAEAAEDGSTTVWFAPEQPDGVARGNWIQTDPEKGWFTILRLYGPLQAFFDKTWRPGEIELVE
ncbi:DUF1254 domain-containing protein [Methyloceanibacter sp.]|uniref:DUF1254 domain-containing protein n=1 Tax=Methyloceanibacter sp. TaxID=1965321 RepID=UPI002CE65A20|nr:DUF1254 domain-containing protein [Methyloceanibacter sp.]HML93032.1 DUF1254 domain-containing protein [Methyloceanibacter sp.]